MEVWKTTSLEDIKRVLNENFELIGKRYKVKTLGVFGSYVRGEESENSDVDVLVEFDEPVGFFKFLELEEYLGGIIGRKVDLVTRKALKPRIGRRILDEVVFL